MGQYFVNHCHRGKWPELFYTINPNDALLMIIEWLTEHQYIDCLPEKIVYRDQDDRS